MTSNKPLVISMRGRATIHDLSLLEITLKTLPEVSETEFLDLYARAKVRHLRVQQVEGGWALVFEVHGRGELTIATARKTLKVWKSVDTLLRFIGSFTGVKEILIKLE